MRQERISAGARRERELRDAAVREAEALFEAHGAAAIAMLSARLVDQTRSSDERRFDRLALLEAERLDRVRRQTGGSRALMVRPARLFSRRWFGQLFRRRRG